LVLFEGVEVADSSVQVASDGPFVVPTMVFQPRVTVEDSGGKPLDGSSVLVSSPGKANTGAYVVEAEYHGVYLPSPLSNKTSIAVPLNHDTALVIRMANLLPPLWLTLGFQLALVVVIAFVSLTLFVLVRRRKLAGASMEAR
jgi:hypothetical protein